MGSFNVLKRQGNSGTNQPYGCLCWWSVLGRHTLSMRNSSMWCWDNGVSNITSHCHRSVYKSCQASVPGTQQLQLGVISAAQHKIHLSCRKHSRKLHWMSTTPAAPLACCCLLQTQNRPRSACSCCLLRNSCDTPVTMSGSCHETLILCQAKHQGHCPSFSLP